MDSGALPVQQDSRVTTVPTRRAILCQKTCLPGDHDTSIHKSHRIHTHTRVYLTSVCISSSSESSDHLNYWASVCIPITLITGLQYTKLYQKLLGFSIRNYIKSDLASVSKFRTRFLYRFFRDCAGLKPQFAIGECAENVSRPQKFTNRRNIDMGRKEAGTTGRHEHCNMPPTLV